MFKINSDIMINLKKKFPNVDVENVIQYLFMEILQKTIMDGSCHIREFGKFVAFGTYSQKLNKNVVRFKFRPSMAMVNKLNNDQFVLNNVPVKSKIPFNEQHEQNCQNKRHIKDLNTQAEHEADKMGHQKTLQNTNVYEIIDLLENKEKK